MELDLFVGMYFPQRRMRSGSSFGWLLAGGSGVCPEQPPTMKVSIIVPVRCELAGGLVEVLWSE